ncbi:MAG: tetratricopeptide repeat protein [Anaerolineae bacterium]|nr:tetratricopeptide repeat protein [Anaerolineae bacterium]
MSKLTRSQRLMLYSLAVVTVFSCAFPVAILVLNYQAIMQWLGRSTSSAQLPPSPSPSPPTVPPTVETPSPTPSPPPTEQPTATPTPTPAPPGTPYDEQVAADPHNPLLRLQRGYAYIELGAYSEAIYDFNTAIALTETVTIQAQACLGRGRARFHSGEWSAALMDFDLAIGLNPNLADAYLWRGYLWSERREYGAAVGDLRQAVALDGTDPLKYLRLADALLGRGDLPGAERAYRAALELAPRSVEACVGLAMVNAAQGNDEQAEAYLDQALRISPNDPQLLNGRAFIYARYRGDRLFEAEQLARQALAKARQPLEKARYLYTIAWAQYRQNRYEEALQTLAEAAALATIEGQVVYTEIIELGVQVQSAQGAQ